MKAKNNTKKYLRKIRKWKKYKKKFSHKQTRFVVSDIALHINKSVSKEKLLHLEEMLLEKSGDDMYYESCKQIFDKDKNKSIDWKSLSKFLYIVFQMSTYHKDLKQDKQNIFIECNPIEINSQKKILWNKFAFSSGDNKLIRMILKKVK